MSGRSVILTTLFGAGLDLLVVVVVVVVVLFYVHGKHLRSCRVMSVSLTTLFLGRLRPPMRINQYFVHILSPVTNNCH